MRVTTIEAIHNENNDNCKSKQLQRVMGNKSRKRKNILFSHQGGIHGKLKGRVSDASLVGCGGYANEFGAAATNGPGESIIKMTLARETVYNMEQGQNAQVSF